MRRGLQEQVWGRVEEVAWCYCQSPNRLWRATWVVVLKPKRGMEDISVEDCLSQRRVTVSPKMESSLTEEDYGRGRFGGVVGGGQCSAQSI